MFNRVSENFNVLIKLLDAWLYCKSLEQLRFPIDYKNLT